MIPQQHRQESLHRAYVAAVAAHAGIKVEFSAGVEYGVDGEFRQIGEYVAANRKKILSEVGYPLDFQLKCTTGCRFLSGEGAEFSYDCDAKAYNKLVLQNRSGTLPVLLLVFCLPPSTSEWLSVNEDGMTLRNACYWHYVNGNETTTSRSHVIRIDRSHLFTPDALKDIMAEVQLRSQK